MGRARTAVLVVVLLSLAVACTSTSTGEESITPLSSGPLPEVPGPALDRPVAAAAGDQVVVWSGHGGGRYRAGGWVIDGDRRWRRLTGNSGARHGIINAGAVWTGEDLIVLGMRCDVSDATYAEQLEENEDTNRCEGNPGIAVRIDPRMARATSIGAPPGVERTTQNNGATAVGWDGVHAWFQVQRENYSHRLVGFDPTAGTWSEIADPPGGQDLEQACVVGRKIVGLADPDGTGTAVAPSTSVPSLWSWSTVARRWSRGPTAPLPVVGRSIVRLSCAAGAVMGNRCGAVPATAAFDVARDRWRTIPSVPSCTQQVVAAVEQALVTTKQLGELVTWSPGRSTWVEVGPTIEPGFDPVPSVYRGRLLLVADVNENDGRQIQLRLVDVTP